MKIAPLQPRAIAFEEVAVFLERDETGQIISASDFQFSGVNVTCEIGHGDVETEGPAPAMLVRLHLRIENKSGKKAPYRISMAVAGVFDWLDAKTPDETRIDLVVVNGASVLYGSIREMVSTITAKSAAGPLLLPSFNFLDNKPSLRSKPDVKDELTSAVSSTNT